MRYKTFALFAMVLVVSISYGSLNAFTVFDCDVGSKSLTKITTTESGSGSTFVLHSFAPGYAEIAAALPRNNYVKDVYLVPRTAHDISIWNAKINHNYPFQIPGTASPPICQYPLLE